MHERGRDVENTRDDIDEWGTSERERVNSGGYAKNMSL